MRIHLLEASIFVVRCDITFANLAEIKSYY
jgi:hypothetical protein